jgi:hypothetical protein
MAIARAAETETRSGEKKNLYRAAYEALAADLAPLKALSAAIKKRLAKAMATPSLEAEIIAFEQVTPRVFGELERQLGVSGLDELAPLLPPSAEVN